MNPEWLTLIFVAILYCLSSWATYSEELRQKWYYLPFAIVLGIILSLIWFITIKYIEDKQRIYVYNLFWDFVMVTVCYLYPVAFLGVKLDKWAVVGLLLIFSGVVLIKFRN